MSAIRLLGITQLSDIRRLSLWFTSCRRLEEGRIYRSLDDDRQLRLRRLYPSNRTSFLPNRLYAMKTIFHNSIISVAVWTTALFARLPTIDNAKRGQHSVLAVEL